MNLVFIRTIIFITLAFGEVIEIPNFALYHVTPQNPEQLRLLNQFRTSDSGMLFIHGVGKIGETIEILTTPHVLELYSKHLFQSRLNFDMHFSSVTIQMSNNGNGNSNGTSGKPSTQNSGQQIQIKDKLKQPPFISIQPIIEPDVYSGVFLKIMSASKEYAFLDSLAIGRRMNSTMGNPYLCLPTTKSGNDQSHSKQWMFEESEMKGYYLLRNKRLPSAYVTWEDYNEQFLVLELRKEILRQFKQGSPSRKNVLFKVEKRAEGFELVIMGRLSKNMHVTIDPTREAENGCYLLRRTNETTGHDGAKLRYLFQIKPTPGTPKIVGHLQNLKYQETVNDLYAKSKKSGKVETITTQTVFNHGDQEISLDVMDSFERRDTFHFAFGNGPMIDSLDELWAPAGLLEAPGINGTEKPLLVMLDKTPGKDTAQKFKYRISGRVQVPPWSSLRYTTVFGRVEKLQMPVEATLKVFGMADRLTKSDSPKLVQNQTISFEYVKNILKGKGFAVEGMKVESSGEAAQVSIRGSIIAKTLGVMGDIETSVSQLSTEISTKCRE